MKLIRFVGIVLATMTFGVAHASIVSVTGNAALISPPASVLVNAGLESNTTAFVFDERQGVTLGANLLVNIDASGTYPPNALTGGTIPAGTVVNSYYFHADPVGANVQNNQTYVATITFDEDILGVSVLDAWLNASNFLGAVGTSYPSGGQGLELGGPDTIIVALGSRSVTIRTTANTAADDFRVITAVPEPATLWLAALAIGAAGAIRRRRI